MAPRTVYANLQDGLQNLSLWDQSLADMGSLGITPCTATGTNSIVLTPIPTAFAPNVSTPPLQLQQFSFVATATSTGAVTVNGLKLYKEDGATQAAANDILINVLYGVVYNSALNGAAGGYQIAFPITSIINPVISGATITNSTYNGNTWTTGTGTLTLSTFTLSIGGNLTTGGTLSTTGTFSSGGNFSTTGTFSTGGNFSTTGTFSTGGNFSASSTVGITGAFSTAAAVTHAGAFASTITVTGVTNSTLPSGTHTLAGLDVAQSWTALQTFNNSNIALLGSSTGATTFSSANAGASNFTLTFPAATDTLVGKATTDTFTNKTFDTGATGNSFSVSGTAVSRGQFPGTNTNDNASSGNNGELISSTVAVGSAVGLTSGTVSNVTSISLTAGDWDVWAYLGFTGGATTTVLKMLGGISTANATLDQTVGRNATLYISPGAGQTIFADLGSSPATNGIEGSAGRIRLSISSTTTVYLVGVANFGTSTCSAYGGLFARRAR